MNEVRVIKNNTPDSGNTTNDYADLCCYSPMFPLVQLGIGVGVDWDAIKLGRAGGNSHVQDTGLFTNRRVDKSHWICDYADDIFQTLRETELKRNIIYFRSQQCVYRPTLLRLLKVATEAHKLSRTTLHLAVYLLDCFMDNYTIRIEKLNLTAITCLIIAAKIEEADIDTPKFMELNKLVGGTYTLLEYKNVEMKALTTFNFDLIRPTAATFAEYFANNIVTLEDFHIYRQNWHSGMFSSQLHSFDGPLPLYSSYEEMVLCLSKLLFTLIDESLSYMRFANVRPSIITAACIAAVRQLRGITPTWSSYLLQLTCCTNDIVEPFKEAVIALHNLHLNKLRNQLIISTGGLATSAVVNSMLCDSPDSGIASVTDTKSDTSNNESDEEEAHSCLEYPVLAKRRRPTYDEESDGEEDYSQTEYPILGKRRKIF